MTLTAEQQAALRETADRIINLNDEAKRRVENRQLREPGAYNVGPGPRTTRPPKGDGIPLEDAAFWLNLCSDLTLTADTAGAYELWHERRSLSLACRLCRLRSWDIEKALGDVRNYGLEPTAAAWAPRMAQADERIIGHIYAGAALGRPGLIKIGFSPAPQRRVKVLGLSLLGTVLGTLLHEWALHQCLWQLPVDPEWYRQEDVPSWLTREEQAA